MLPPNKNRYQSPPIMQIPEMLSGPFTPGKGGMSPEQLPTGDIRTIKFTDDHISRLQPIKDERRTGGIKPPFPVKLPPINTIMPVDPRPLPPVFEDTLPLPPMSTPPSMDLFGPPGAGTYDAIMSRTAQDYMSQPSPYAGMSEFLLNRPVFDRGPSPERQPMASPTPTFSYGNQAGAQGLAALSAQQPMMQEQYDRFAQQIQSAQEAAQQQAQQQTDLAASERQALMDRITALESQEGPDLDAFGAQLRQDILGQMPEQIDVDALRREITGEVLAVAQQDFPDVTQIRDEVMRLLPEQEQIDVENLRRQIQESIDAGAPPEQIEALRQELQNRIRPVEEQLAAIQDERPDIARQIGELRGEIGALPDINVEELRAQIINQLPEQERLDIEALQRQIQEGLDAGMSPEQLRTLREELQNRLRPVEEQIRSIQDERPDITRQIGELRGELDALPDIDVEQIRQSIINQLPEQERLDIEDLQRRIQESIDTGAPEQEIQNLRTELNARLQPVEERVGQIRESIGELRTQVDLGPQIDVEDIRRRVEEGLTDRFQTPGFNPEAQRQIDELRRQFEEGRGRVDPDILERLRSVEQREGPDLSAIREQIGRLRGRLDERPTIDPDAIARRVRENIDVPEVDLSNIQTQIAALENRGLPPEVLERLRAVEQREGPDLGSLREQIGELRGRLDQQPRDTGVVSPDVLERLRAVEQREGPDLSGITAQIAALENRGLPPEVLERLRAVEQREGPDEAAIAERVRSGLNPRIADLQQRLSESDTSSQAMAERIAQLRGRLDERPTIDTDAIAQQVREGIDIPQVDLSGLREQIANLRGRIDERPAIDPNAIARQVRESIDIPQVDLSGLQTQIAALENRGLPPEVLERLRAVEQREGPDEVAIAERVRSGLDPRITDLQQRFSEVDTSSRAMADRIAALREQQGQATEGRRGLSDRLAALQEQQGQAAEGRRALEDRLSGRLEEVRGQVSPLTERIAQLRGRLDERPTVDMDAIARRVREGIDIPQVDLSGIREQIANLRGRVDERPTIDPAVIARQVRESIDIPQVDLSGVQNQIAALENRGLPPEVLERLRAVEQREGPDLSDITRQIGELRGRVEATPQVDTEALRRQIIEDVRQPVIDLSGIRSQIAALENRGLPPEVLERLRAVEQRKGPDLGSIREQIGALRGRLDERPVLDEAAITRRIKESIKPQRIDVDALRRQIQEGIKVPRVDLGDIRQQLGALQGRLDQRPQVTTEDVQRLIRQGLANRTTAGVRPTPRVRGRIR